MSINNNKILSAHQPNFLPWFGYFEKIIKSDIFVFSDDVVFVKQQLTNRAFIKNNQNDDIFVTIPINRNKGRRLFEKKLSNDYKLVEKSINKILNIYKDYKFINEVKAICDKIIEYYYNNLSISQININIIKYICEKLEIKNTFYLGSKLDLQFYSRNERLLKRAQKLKIMTYLHGKGAQGYHDNFYLESNGMKLVEIEYDITKKIFNEEHKLSIINHIAKLGLQEIKNRITEWNYLVTALQEGKNVKDISKMDEGTI